MALVAVLVGASARADQTFYVTAAAGVGDGTSAAAAAHYSDASFWSGVQAALADGPVSVTFLNGQYRSNDLILQDIGKGANRLTVRSQTQGGAVFRDGRYFQLRGATNVRVSGLGFTGNDPSRHIYKLQVTNSAASGPSTRIRFDNNVFYDAPTYYGAIGVAHGSNHVTIDHNTFRNIGGDSHAHMIYNAYDAHHIKVIANQFEDSSGDYVRFRDNLDYGEVRGNTFLSTNASDNRPFVQMPVFNDVDPGDETHASHYLIADNRFTYDDTSDAADHRDAMGYYSSGYEPAGLNYLPSAVDGEVLTNGTTEEKRELMLQTMGIDLTQVRVVDNEYHGVHRIFRYVANPAYGAQSDGWTGIAYLTDTVNRAGATPGDVEFDGQLTDADATLFVIAFEADDEMAFLLDDRVWFGVYGAADLDGNGDIDALDASLFLDMGDGVLSDGALAPVRALVPEPASLGLLSVGLIAGLTRPRTPPRGGQAV